MRGNLGSGVAEGCLAFKSDADWAIENTDQALADAEERGKEMWRSKAYESRSGWAYMMMRWADVDA